MSQDGKKPPTPKKRSPVDIPSDGIQHSMMEHVNTEHWLAIELAKAQTAMGAVRYILKEVGTKPKTNANAAVYHATIQAAIQILEDALSQ